MYKPDPNQPKTESVNTDKSDSKVVELENKLRRLTEDFTKMQAELARMNRAIKRQGSEVSTVIGRINKVR
jgi:molecular chaperone GrpE (heat shock protein)